MPTWPAKDPDSVLDYTYTIPLDAGDSVDTSTFEKLSGDTIIDSQNRVAAVWTVTLSGGTDGEMAVYRVAWVTVAGRSLDDIITQAVVANEITELVLTGYAKPSAAHLITRYPAFAAVDVGTIRHWLTDGERHVDTSWTEGDYAAGIMAWAAHSMAVAGLGTDAAALAGIPAGLTSLKSGALSVSFSDDAANGRASGSLGSTRYGAEYLALARRNKGGPRVMATGTLPYDPWRYPHGEA